MLHVLLIAVFVALYIRDGLDAPLLRAQLFGAPRAFVPIWSIASVAIVWLITDIFIRAQGQRMDRTGSLRAARRAESALAASRITAVVLHAFNILALGWLDSVRAGIGDLIAIDELAACAPVLLTFILGWWSIFPIDRRIREAVLLHELDQGRILPPMPNRWAFVLAAARHQMSLVLLPLVCILSWSELIEYGARHRYLRGTSPMAVQLLGMAAIITLMPAVLRRVWDTVALGPGDLRDRLISMCRAQRIRVRELLVWRTHGTMINGAVMGLIWPLRYILLTDALIEHLPPDQVEAVTAHELGHVRRRHILWLAASALSSIFVLSVGAEVGLTMWRRGSAETILAQAVIGIVSLGTGLIVFGFVSRRFEWQADAFAVQHLSGFRPGNRRGVTLTQSAVDAMSGALESVAQLNHIPRRRFSWRHGSIATRQQRLADLIGRPADRLGIDRQARMLAVGSAMLAALAAALIVYSSVLSPPPSRAPRRAQERFEYGGSGCDLSRCMESGTTTSTSMRSPTRS